jgi:signal transduction histidine kinase
MANQTEKQLLHFSLILGIGYQLYQSVSSLWTATAIQTTIFNIIVSLFFLFLLIQLNKTKAFPTIALTLHLMLLGAFYFFWLRYGGFAGTVPLFLCNYFGFIIATSSGLYRAIAIGTYAVFTGALLYFPSILAAENSFNRNAIPLHQKSIDFLIVAAMTMAFILFLKNKYISYRKQIRIRNIQLMRIANTLQQQNEELKSQQEEIQAINDNLEDIITERTKSIEQKSNLLSEFAFINAHLLRGPLCRIIGLINLIEMEKEADLTELKKQISDVDKIVKSINQIVSE